ncbi:MAG: hypothetical protein KC449_12325, partial [Anaerolineales bacterium]|nr:hypothetical protein [Anaerolineales bacterium]
ASDDHTFVRTPKQGTQTHSPLLDAGFDWIVLVELGLALYAWVGVGIAIQMQNYGPLFFLGSCGLAYSFIFTLTLRDWWTHLQQARQETAVSPQP